MLYYSLFIVLILLQYVLIYVNGVLPYPYHQINTGFVIIAVIVMSPSFVKSSLSILCEAEPRRGKDDRTDNPLWLVRPIALRARSLWKIGVTPPEADIWRHFAVQLPVLYTAFFFRYFVVHMSYHISVMRFYVSPLTALVDVWPGVSCLNVRDYRRIWTCYCIGEGQKPSSQIHTSTHSRPYIKKKEKKILSTTQILFLRCSKL